MFEDLNYTYISCKIEYEQWAVCCDDVLPSGKTFWKKSSLARMEKFINV